MAPFYFFKSKFKSKMTVNDIKFILCNHHEILRNAPLIFILRNSSTIPHIELWKC